MIIKIFKQRDDRTILVGETDYSSGGGGIGDVTASGTLTNDTVILGNGSTVVKSSSKTIVTTLGSDDLTLPTSKAVKNITDGKKNYHGIVSRLTNPLPSNLTTTTFTLGTTANPLSYYMNGVLTNVTANKTATIGGTAGLKFIYFTDDAGTLTSYDSFQGLDGDKVILATVYWNGSNYGIVNDERHSYDRDISWHTWAHSTIGARYGTGLGFSFAGTTIANTTFNISSGNIYDEDIYFIIGTQTQARIWYQTGASTYGFDSTISTTPYKHDGSGIQCVNSSTYALATVTAANRYLNFFVYGGTSNLAPIHIFAETTATTGGYTSVSNARAVPAPSLSGFGLSPEYKLLYRIVVNGAGLVQTLISADDYRTTSTLAGGVVPTSSASSVTESNYGNVQTAINTLLSDKVPTSRTITINGTTYDLSADRSWTVSASGTKQIRITIPGELIADTAIQQGFYFYNDTGATITISNVAFTVSKAAAGTGAAAAFNVYKSSGTAADGIDTNAVNLFTSAVDLTTNYTSLTNTPNTTTVESGRYVSTRVTSSAGATNKASNAQIIITYT